MVGFEVRRLAPPDVPACAAVLRYESRAERGPDDAALVMVRYPGGEIEGE